MNIQLQDNWNGPEISQKEHDIKELLYFKDETTHSNMQKLRLNHISATNGSIGHPIGYADRINTDMLSELDHVIAIIASQQCSLSHNRTALLKNGKGALIYDFIDEELSHKTISVNQLVENIE